MKTNDNCYGKSLTTLLMIVVVVLIAFWSYHDILGYFFTATDSLTLIDTSRIQSSGDVIRIFTEPLMNGTQFTDVYRYYRPITTLSFSMDYALWGVNPFGYHLTDLMLHVVVCLLVFFVIRSLTGGQRGTAWLGALLFSIHPVLMESVPANARRQDILAAMFLLLSMISFLKFHREAPRRKGMLCWSLFLYALALGSKELAAVLPFMLLSYFILCDSSGAAASLWRKIARSVEATLPFLIMTVVYLLWRTHVLKGLGGIIALKDSGNPWFFKQPLSKIVALYGIELIDPQYCFGGSAMTILVIGTISALALFVLSARIVHKIHRRPTRGWIESGHLWRVAVDLLLFAIILSSAMRLLIGNLETDFVSHMALYSAIWLALILAVPSIGRFLRGEHSGRLLAVWLVWLSFPVTIYAIAKQIPLRGMYVPAIPFSAILSLILVGSYGTIVHRSKEVRSDQDSRPSSSKKSRTFGIILFVVALFISVQLAVSSPFFAKNTDWETSGMVASLFLKKLSQVVPQLPRGAGLDIFNLPHFATTHSGRVGAQSVTQLHQRSVQSWLNINHPGKRLTVRINRYANFLDAVPKDFDLQTWVSPSGDEVKMRVKTIY